LRGFNLARSLLIIVVAFAANSVTALICSLLGASPSVQENVPVIAMVLAALFAYTRLNKNKHNSNRKKP
jgi:hypothetical protein